MKNQLGWITLAQNGVKLPIPFSALFDENSDLSFYVGNDQFQNKVENTIDRKLFDGIISVVGKINGQSVGLLWNDFKIHGGSFGKDNSKRICSFLKQLEVKKIPLIFALNTIGVRIMEGRSVFSNAFSILPSLNRFRENNLLITCSMGKCLGLGTLFFEMGDYRLSLAKETSLNLSGPEILKLFFGSSVDFEKLSSSDTHLNKTRLIHDVFDSKEALLQHIRSFLTFHTAKSFNNSKVFEIESRELTQRQQEARDKMARLLNNILGSGDHKIFELFQSTKTSVRCFIVASATKRYGLFVNPPGLANMIDVNTIKQYMTALEIFKKLKLPVVSIVNTSGADPRDELNIIQELNKMTCQIIHYPYAKVGIIHERSYGGASVLTFPNIFGGEATLAMKNCKMNIMDSNLIKHLFEKSPRLLEEWMVNHEKENAELTDMIETGLVDKLIDETDIRNEIEMFLNKEDELSVQLEVDRSVFLISTPAISSIDIKKEIYAI